MRGNLTQLPTSLPPSITKSNKAMFNEPISLMDISEEDQEINITLVGLTEGWEFIVEMKYREYFMDVLNNIQ